MVWLTEHGTRVLEQSVEQDGQKARRFAMIRETERPKALESQREPVVLLSYMELETSKR